MTPDELNEAARVLEEDYTNLNAEWVALRIEAPTAEEVQKDPSKLAEYSQRVTSLTNRNADLKERKAALEIEGQKAQSEYRRSGWTGNSNN